MALSTSAIVYLAVMLSVILGLTVVLGPALFLKRCGACGARNALDAHVCRRCKRPFHDGQAGR